MKLLLTIVTAAGLFFSGVVGLNKPVATQQTVTAIHAFEEPLILIGKDNSPDEDAALVTALQKYQNRKTYEDVSAITSFLETHPNSQWKFSLLADLGITYRKTGHFSRAIDAWEQSWALGKDEKDIKVQALANRVAAELASLLSSLGRTERLDSLLKETKERTIYGSANALLVTLRENLWLMKNKPEDSFKCGAYALDSILTFENKKNAHNKLIGDAQSSPKGFSLTQVRDLSNSLKMNYQMARKQPGADFIIPSVVHWKSGHFAALLKKEGDHYRTKDPTFGQEILVTGQALEDESSGYYLVPNGPLPNGWQAVSDTEGATIWGQGAVFNRVVDATKPNDCATCAGDSKGMPVYSILLMLVSLRIEDTPEGYTPPIGPPVQCTVTYNQLEANQPTTYSYFNFGPCWNCSWLSYVTIPYPVTNTAYVNIRGGGRETYTPAGSPVTDSLGYINYYPNQIQGQATLWVSSTGTTYERRLPDGSKEVFSQPSSASSPVYMFLTAIVDPQGNSIAFTYDTTSSYYASTHNLRLTTVTDALGLTTTLAYTSTDPLKVTKVTDPYGRYAAFTYGGTPLQLGAISDVMSINSYFYYGSGSDVSQMVTPYGTTNFTMSARGGVANPNDTVPVRTVNVVEPDLGQVQAESHIDGTGYPYSTGYEPTPSGYGLNVSSSYPYYRNTFYWNKKAMHDMTDIHGVVTIDYTKAYIYHFLHSGYGVESPVLESEKPALENRIWYNYANQPFNIWAGTSDRPTIIARVIGSGTQAWRYQYSNTANPAAVTAIIDPMGRQTNFTYDTATGVDLIGVTQNKVSGTDTLATITYDSHHRPLFITDASGQATHYTFNSQEQVTSVSPPIRAGHTSAETTTYSYTGNYLTSITGSITGAVTTISYDTSGGQTLNRIKTITDSESYTLTGTYDNLDHLTQILYPDGTKDKFQYNDTTKPLDLSDTYDRLNRHTHYAYNTVRHLTDVTDPLSHLTHYEWCNCGSLQSITDANGHVTIFNRDVEGRITSKVYQDATHTDYAYDSVGRLSTRTDFRGDLTTASYNLDNTVSAISYSVTGTTVATPTVTLNYDTYYNRLTSATIPAGVGGVAVTYNAVGSLGANKPNTVTNTLTGGLAVTTYAYDEWGRRTGRSIDTGNSEAAVFDSLGRVTSIVNALCPTSTSFGFTYFDPTHPTNRLDTISYPNGQSTVFTYFNSYGSFSATGDENLKEIKNLTPTSAVLSQQDYTYDAIGKILTWKQQTDNNTPLLWTESYDAADRLTSAVQTNTSTLAVLNTDTYGYDLVGNHTNQQLNSAQTVTGNNTVNQINSVAISGVSEAVPFTGTLNTASTVTINGAPATVSGTSFSGSTTLTSGTTSTVSIVATDSHGNQRTNHYQYTAPLASVTAPSFDADGNEINDGLGRAFTWDAENRLIKITMGSNTYQFGYDAVGRRISETDNGTLAKQWVWDGARLLEERGGSNTVTKRFFDQGEQIGMANYYYTFDHLGSIREMTSSTGAIQARYDYDPYGRPTKISGSLDSDLQYAGYYEHAASGLNLTLFRAYDSNMARWLSRDPLGEGADATLYSYVANNPIYRFDSFGLAWESTPTQGIHYNDRNSDFGFGLGVDENGRLVPMPMNGHTFDLKKAQAELDKAIADKDKWNALKRQQAQNFDDPAYADKTKCRLTGRAMRVAGALGLLATAVNAANSPLAADAKDYVNARSDFSKFDAASRIEQDVQALGMTDSLALALYNSLMDAE